MQFERAKTSYQSLTINNGPKVNSPNDVTNAAAFVSLGKFSGGMGISPAR